MYKFKIIIVEYITITFQMQKTDQKYYISFNKESFEIAINNRCSVHILGNPKDFIRELKDSNRIVKGFMDTKITNMQTGTLLWK